MHSTSSAYGEKREDCCTHQVHMRFKSYFGRVCIGLFRVVIFNSDPHFIDGNPCTTRQTKVCRHRLLSCRAHTGAKNRPYLRQQYGVLFSICEVCLCSLPGVRCVLRYDLCALGRFQRTEKIENDKTMDQPCTRPVKIRSLKRRAFGTGAGNTACMAAPHSEPGIIRLCGAACCDKPTFSSVRRPRKRGPS